MKPLKADLHIHTSEDPEDLIRYSAKDLINKASTLGYQVLAITNHNHVTFSEYLRDYARERGIILIPGMEATIERRHVLLYNLDFSLISRHDLKSLANVRDQQGLVIAPHPFYPSTMALRAKLIEYIHLFDGIEHCHFYSRTIDFNAKAKQIAKRYNLPMVGTSDAHQWCQFHTTYSLIEAEPDTQAVIEAIKLGRVTVVSEPLPMTTLLKIQAKMFWRNQVRLKFMGSHKGPVVHQRT